MKRDRAPPSVEVPSRESSSAVQQRRVSPRTANNSNPYARSPSGLSPALPG